MISLNETAAAVAALLRHNYNRVGSCFEQVRSTGIAVKIIYTAEIALLSHSNKETLEKKKKTGLLSLFWWQGIPPASHHFLLLFSWLEGQTGQKLVGGSQQQCNTLMLMPGYLEIQSACQWGMQETLWHLSKTELLIYRVLPECQRIPGIPWWHTYVTPSLTGTDMSVSVAMSLHCWHRPYQWSIFPASFWQATGNFTNKCIPGKIRTVTNVEWEN